MTKSTPPNGDSSLCAMGIGGLFLNMAGRVDTAGTKLVITKKSGRYVVAIMSNEGQVVYRSLKPRALIHMALRDVANKWLINNMPHYYIAFDLQRDKIIIALLLQALVFGDIRIVFRSDGNISIINSHSFEMAHGSPLSIDEILGQVVEGGAALFARTNTWRA